MMATFTALIFSVLAVPISSIDLHEFVQSTSLTPHQNPWKFISNESTAYLLSVSISPSPDDIPQPPCVRSRFWNKSERSVNRSLDIYNATINGSINVALNIKYEESRTILDVDVEGQIPSIMNIPDMKTTSPSKIGYTFLVLYSDHNCLILAETLKTERIKKKYLRCWMWLPQSRIQRVPKCCEFIYTLLCLKAAQDVKVFQPSCLTDQTTGRSSSG
uniref:Lipocalin n=1 Tax=Rhipicephalus appendiculatus TaxID=34631 RepID=A0A131YHP1_RHIAP